MFSVPDLFLFAFGLSVVNSFSHYQTLIPNGQHVPSPCKNDERWIGVGHRNPAGGGARNQFGLDFASNDHNWTRACGLDSDGDGLTNGQELGDPDCTWKPGLTPSRSHNLSHPGVCEPADSRSCLRKNLWLRTLCRRPSGCEALNDTTVVLKRSLRFPPTRVPAAKNTHMCLGINLPDDVTVNNKLPIAVEPVLDNSVVMHHINLWGCIDTPRDESYSTPTQCKRSRECRPKDRVRLWTTGQKVRCRPAELLKFHVNATHLKFKYAVIELHWRNELLSTDHVDSSGIVMYYRDSGGNGGNEGYEGASSDSVTTADLSVKSTLTLLMISLHFFALKVAS